MNPPQVSLTLTLLCFIITINLCSIDPSHFTDDTVSINCGSAGTSSAHSGTKWLQDVQPRASPLLQLKGSSTASTAISKRKTSADPVPYMTARVSRSRFSYAFQVNPGQKIIRLHFNPTPYTGFKGLKDLFTVEAGSFTLLGNFSASLTAKALRLNSFTKEFCLNIQENQLLHITFSAETKDAYAFINGIEIVSVPASLSYFHGGDIGLQVVGWNSLVKVDNSVALEIVRRVNTKQELISSANVGNRNYVSWRVSVDVGFRYLVRLHFSKIGLKMAETGALKFKVFINEMIADINSDLVVKERGGSTNSIPWYGDYIVTVNGHKRKGKRDLLICLQSNEEFMDGPLKGFEILKMSNPDNSLASPVPMPPSRGNGKAIGSLVVAILSIVCFVVHKLRENSEAGSSEEVNRPSPRAERLCRRFSLSEMQLATRNFSDGLVIGRGGFGDVYKGLIDNKKNTVAVKRLNPNSRQGEHEFLTEIETLSELRHINLVSLIGYCSKGREMLLVYEYIARGTLSDHLYKLERRGEASSLTWKQRLIICIGAARGLDYLHTGHRVIHRDVKASNILLDDNFVAKVSDFGLAKAEDRNKLQSHVTTMVKGTRGYLDPYYLETNKLTCKSDTYALGVVLLEVLCGRAALDSGVPDEERLLATWGRDKIRKGEVDQIVALSLRDEISPNSLKAFVGIAERCLDKEPNNRPTMSQVVLQLEFALEQQDNKNLRLDMEENRTQRTSTRPLNNEVINSERKQKGKPTRNKPSGIWDALWKKQSKYELLSSGVKLRKFNLDQIAAATNNFSSTNIVGRDRYDKAVYKGFIPSGMVVAVKRCPLSKAWKLEELQNEINVLSNLEHQNIIKLHGFCIDGEDILLVYEFVENALHLVISRKTSSNKRQQKHLEWGVHFQIIMGVARGLVYLHHDSGLKVIHRDLNLRNILLDLEMNPKISIFELAWELLELNESELDTARVLRNNHYMPPEYWRVEFSVKTNVYSFGIILLEIVSGAKFSPADWDHGFPYKVWKVWTEGRAIDLVDDSVDASGKDEAIRCIQVAFLCIQEDPNQRPLMSSVIKMLQGNEEMMQPHTPSWFTKSTNNIIEGRGI